MPRSNRVQPAPLADRKRKVAPTQGNKFSSAPTTTLATRPLSARTLTTASTSTAPAAAAPADTTTTSSARPRTTRARAPPISRPSAVADAGAKVGFADALPRVDDVPDVRRGGRRAVLLVPLVAAAALRDEVVRAVLPRVVGVVGLVEGWWGRRRGCRLLLVVVVLAVLTVVCHGMSDFRGERRGGVVKRGAYLKLTSIEPV